MSGNTKGVLRTLRPAVVLAVARAETRTTRRLIHYWLFAALTVGIGCMVYAQLAMTHGDYSGTASGLGTFNPQFYVGLFGAYFYLWLFVGLIFFAFEIRNSSRWPRDPTRGTRVLVLPPRRRRDSFSPRWGLPAWGATTCTRLSPTANRRLGSEPTRR